MEKTNINITEEIARIEEEVAQLEKELEELQKEREEYNNKKQQLQQNPFIAQSAKDKIDKELTNLLEKSQELQAQIKEKQENIANLGSLILGVAYDDIAKDDEMVDAIIAGYIQNIADEITEKEKEKKEIDSEITEYIGMIEGISQDKSYAYCYRSVSPFNDETTSEYLGGIAKDGQRLNSIEKRIDDLNEKELVPEREYKQFKQLIEALRLGACDPNNVNTVLIWMLASIDRGLVIERLNNLPYKEKITDENTLVLPNGKTISKETIEALKNDLIQVLEPSEEYIREMFMRETKVPEETEGEYEFQIRTMCEMLKGKHSKKDMIEVPNSRGAMISAKALHNHLDSILSSYQQYETQRNIQEICDAYEFRFEKTKCMQQAYKNEYIKQLINGATKHEDILFIFDLMGIDASYGEIDTKYSETYKQALRDLKTNATIDQDINGLTTRKRELEESSIEEKRQRIKRTLQNPKFLKGNLVSPQTLDALKSKIDAYNGKTGLLAGNKQTRQQLESQKRQLDAKLAQYNADLNNALSEGETPEAVEEKLLEDLNGVKLGEEIYGLCSGAISDADILEDYSPVKNELNVLLKRLSSDAYDRRTRYEKIQNLNGFEEVIDSMIEDTNNYVAGNKKSVEDCDEAIEKLNTEIKQLTEDIDRIKKGKNDSLYKHSDGRPAVFKFFFRFTKQYKKNQKRLLEESQMTLDRKNSTLSDAKKQKDEYKNKAEQYTIQKEKLVEKKQKLEQNGILEKINKMLEKYKVLTKYLLNYDRKSIMDRKELPVKEQANQEEYNAIQGELQELKFTQEEVDHLIETYPNIAEHIRYCIDNQEPLQIDLMRIIEQASKMRAEETNLSSEYGDTFADAAMSGAIIATGLTPEEEMEMIKEGGRKK